jgi:hypothetical protein
MDQSVLLLTVIRVIHGFLAYTETINLPTLENQANQFVARMMKPLITIIGNKICLAPEKAVFIVGRKNRRV